MQSSVLFLTKQDKPNMPKPVLPTLNLAKVDVWLLVAGSAVTNSLQPIAHRSSSFSRQRSSSMVVVGTIAVVVAGGPSSQYATTTLGHPLTTHTSPAGPARPHKRPARASWVVVDPALLQGQRGWAGERRSGRESWRARGSEPMVQSSSSWSTAAAVVVVASHWSPR